VPDIRTLEAIISPLDHTVPTEEEEEVHSLDLLQALHRTTRAVLLNGLTILLMKQDRCLPKDLNPLSMVDTINDTTRDFPTKELVIILNQIFRHLCLTCLLIKDLNRERHRFLICRTQRVHDLHHILVNDQVLR
jgi:hypothetical protein